MTGMLRYWMLVPALFLSLSLGGVDVASAQSAEPAAKPARASKSSGPRVAQAGRLCGVSRTAMSRSFAAPELMWPKTSFSATRPPIARQIMSSKYSLE